MGQRRRALRVVLLGTAILAALAVLALAWVLGTGSGARWALDRFAPPALAVERVEGRLAGPLTLEGVRWDGASVSARAARVRLDLSPGTLLRRTLRIRRLSARDVTLVQAAGRMDPVVVSPERPDRPWFRVPRLPEPALPVRIVVDSAVLERLAYVPAPRPGSPAAVPYRARLLRASGSADRDGAFEVGALLLAPELDPRTALEARLAAEGVLRRPHPVAADLRWEARRADLAPMAGRGRLSGDLGRLELQHVLSRPLEARLRATLRAGDGPPAWEASLDVARFRLAAVRPEWPTREAEGHLRAEGNARTARVMAALALGPVGPGDVQLRVRAAVGGGSVVLDTLLARLPGGGRFRARGRADRDGPDTRFDAEAVWTRLSWPPVGPPDVRSPDGRLRVAGTPESYALRADVDVDGPAVPPGRWRLEGSGGRDEVRLGRLLGATLGGTVSGTARVAWSPRRAAALALEARGLEPERWRPAWPGEVSARLEAEGVRGPDGPHGRAELVSLQGTLRGEPLQGRASLRAEGTRLVLDTLNLALGDARLDAGGTGGTDGTAWDLSGRLRVPRLELFAPDPLAPVVSGSVELRGAVRGPADRLGVESSLQVDSLRASGVRVASAVGGARVEAAGRGPSRVWLEADGVAGEERRRAGLDIETVRLEAEGRRGEHAVELRIAGSDSEFRLSARGGVAEARTPVAAGASALAGDDGDGAGPEWRGTLQALSLLPTDRSGAAARRAWTLLRPTRLALGPERARVEPLCWRRGFPEAGARLHDDPVPEAVPAPAAGEGEPRPGTEALCLEGDWERAAGGEASFRIADVSLDVLDPVLPEGTSLTGRVGGRGSAAFGGAGVVVGSAELRAGPGEVRYLAGGQPLTRPYDTLALTVAVEPDSLRGRLVLAMEGAAAEATMRRTGSGGGAALKGSARLSFEDRGLLGAVLESVDGSGGRAFADLALSGTADAPRVAGRLEVEEGRGYVVPLGIGLSDLRLTARSLGDERWTMSGRAEADEGGTLALEGVGRAAGDRPWEADLAVRGDRFPGYRGAAGTVWVSPDLRLAASSAGATVTGEVAVPRAELTPEELELAIQASDDEVLVGPGTEPPPPADPAAAGATDSAAAGAGEPVAPELPFATRAQVRLVMGDSVRIDAFGLGGRLAGDLLVLYEPGRPILGRGELDIVDGRYAAYQQELEVEHGRLLFADAPVQNPGLDVRVVRRPEEDVLVGLDVRGTARRPEAALFSEPAMTDAEALSYLILGRSLREAEKSDGELLTDAVRSAGVAGGDALAARLGAAFGLEEARVEHAAAGGSSLVVGSQVAPGLYVSYSLSLFEGTDALTIRYDLEQGWVLKTQTGFETAVDLLYQAEDREEDAEDSDGEPQR